MLKKNVIVGFGYFILPVKGFLGLKMKWKNSPGSFQKVTTASSLNGYELGPKVIINNIIKETLNFY